MEKINQSASIDQISVGIQFEKDIIPVGRLAIRNQDIFFEYHPDYISKGLNISPFKLPLTQGVQSFNPRLFEGLPGVFNDSLPDGWGRLLFDRLAKSKNLLPNQFSPLDRLAHIGRFGLGALTYEPDQGHESADTIIDLDSLATQTQEVLAGEADEVLNELVKLNGSSAGARPKALIGIDPNNQNILHGERQLRPDQEYWMVKFANSMDGPDAGAIEYVYSLMAQEAGISMTPTRLFPAKQGAGYFATKRFDRTNKERFHMHTASGLLHSDFRVPVLDYEDLLTLTEALTKDFREVEKMFRLAVFNVFSHNRDDHGKNFSFLMDKHGEWKMSPAYDLTFSSGPRGHQSTMVMGEGQNPSMEHLIKLAKEGSLTQKQVELIIEQTKEALCQWETLAKHHDISASNIKLIKSRLQI
ncbi:MAG: type II toxin-antitoxin system HipA family toxin [Reichenbachiella sp.]|uniref:type II toxin-antitoxin system HipA family toxin n=1 Tax=Reichenbachiella sp. TaxID=2184521 RepID=UPI0029674621|nr:type II toxin-antitoxin system HipA family toxin [Reichenbachiella sp.]MDW3209316.1 type II toxin-antitoxin system HipA family toxin [Reichenbachiella sp.]